MSRLPEYQPIPNTEDDPPPWTKSGANDQRARDRDSTESDSTPYGDTSYPPGQPGLPGLSGLSGPTGPPGRADGTAATVTFTFQPRWPTGGTQSSVMGTIGETREVSGREVDFGVRCEVCDDFVLRVRCVVLLRPTAYSTWGPSRRGSRRPSHLFPLAPVLDPIESLTLSIPLPGQIEG